MGALPFKNAIRPLEPITSATPGEESPMSDKLYPVSGDWAKRAYVDDAKYKAMYDASIKDPEAFWGSMASASIG